LNTDAAERLQGALRISEHIWIRLATGAYSHPCSDAPRWHIPVPALPGDRRNSKCP